MLSLPFLNVQRGIKNHGQIGVSLFVLCRSNPFLLPEDVWDVLRGRLLLASHLHVYSTSERPPRRSRLSQTVWFIATFIYGCFGRPLSLHCAFHMRILRSQSDINDDAKHVPLYQSLSYVWGYDTIKIIGVSGIGVWVCRTSQCRDLTSLANVSRSHREAVRVLFKESDALIGRL